MEKQLRPRRGLAAGAVAGLCCGLFGGGGGMLLVPLLSGWVGLSGKRAFASCLAIIAPLCLVSAGIYWFRGRLEPLAALPYMLGGALGGFLAGKSFDKIPVSLLQKVLIGLLLYGGGRALFCL